MINLTIQDIYKGDFIAEFPNKNSLMRIEVDGFKLCAQVISSTKDNIDKNHRDYEIHKEKFKDKV